MKAIRISDSAYDFLVKISKEEKRSLVSTLDFFIDLFKEVENEELDKGSLSSSRKTKTENTKQALASVTKKNI